MEEENTSLWVFGYGSLCWNPGFEYKSSKIGYINDYVRRFWQGNTTHRGVPGKPGRVATLVPEQNGKTYGVAFEVVGETALRYLNCREVELGGYRTEVVSFTPRQGRAFSVLLYIATPESREWSGPAPLPRIARQITACRGPAGHNVEYLLRLADFIKDYIPECYDDHLLSLESLVRTEIRDNDLCLKDMMGSPCNTHVLVREASQQEEERVVASRESVSTEPKQNFSSKISGKKLRCVNV